MTHVSVKLGAVSFEWETQAELSLADLDGLLDRIESLAQLSSAAPVTDTGARASAIAPGEAAAIGQLHINSIAASMGVSSGPDLAVAAAASLQVIQKKASFTRQELLVAMREATKFYNANMSGNLSKILGTLVGSRFNQVGQNSYSMTSAEFNKVEALLAQSG